jgi:hypothetical protein
LQTRQRRLVLRKGLSWDSRPIHQVVDMEAMDALPYNKQDDHGRERADLGRSGLWKKVSAGLQGPVGPLCFFPFFFLKVLL